VTGKKFVHDRFCRRIPPDGMGGAEMRKLVIPMIMLATTVAATELAGHYYLQNVREIGSELVLKPDGIFEYMLAYGAADYWAKGTWRSDKGAVILDSGAEKAKPPIRLLRSTAKSIPGVRIVVEAANGRPVPNIDVALIDASEPAQGRTDSDGAALLNARNPHAAVFRIRVYQFESKPIALNPEHNEFTFEIHGEEITQVRFRGERLEIDGKALVMQHWGQDRPMRYEKQ